MSFSSTISHSPREKKQRALSLSEALFELGFAQARAQNYDWMTTYPDAISLLEEIRTSTDRSSVLSVPEAEKLKTLSLSHEHVSPKDIIDAAYPLTTAPHVKDVAPTRAALVTSLRTRVQNLKLQRKILQDACLEKRDSCNLKESTKRNEDRQKRRNIKVLKLRAAVERLMEYASQNLGALHNNSEVIRYCDAEAKHTENIAHVVTQGFQSDLSEAFNYQENMTLRTRRTINAYAKLKRIQCMYRALVIRDAAMIASLGTNDGRYLEMTSPSMHSLIKELQNNSTKAMQLKATKVSEASREVLQKGVNHFSLSERARQQDEYISAMRNCISLYLQQRLRVHCLQSVANHVTVLRERAEGLLENTLPDLSSMTFDRERKPFSSTAESDDELWSNELGRSTKIVHGSCDVCNDGKQYLQDLEDKAFSAHVEGIASEIASLTSNATELNVPPRSWLRFSSRPQNDALIKDLEAQLGQNTSVLEALLQKKSAILDKASSSVKERSPNRSWISRINASHSPKYSSYSSTMSQ